jgi:histidinol dehydrogenase
MTSPQRPAQAHQPRAPWRVYAWSEIGEEDRTRILRRSTGSTFDPELLDDVRTLIEDVRVNGDAAVSRALERFDHCTVAPDRLRVERSEIEAAAGRVSEELRRAIRYGLDNIRRFNERQVAERDWRTELAPGITAGERLTPVESAGLYVPAGKGSFPSVLMQIGTPAVVAGVHEIAVIVPPAAGGGGVVDPAVLFVAHELGIERVYRANGPAGIAALAFGTETIPRTLTIAGPGSPPITAAQILVQLHGVRTHLLLGPSESLIIADEHANPDWIAADLLNEAEHGPDSASLLVTPSESLVEQIALRIAPRIAALPEPRRGWAERSLSHFGGVILVDGLDEAAEVSNAYAPEHMIIDVADPEALLGALVNAGEILIGPWSPVSAANYAIGVPAALPTGGYAKVSSGLTARAFMKSTSIARLSEDGLRAMSDAIVTLARHEGFPAHAASLEARLGPRNGRG